MSVLPEEVRKAWKEREVPAVLATVSESGVPNVIYVTCVNLLDDDRVVIADNYFNKTRANILAGCKGALLFRSKSGEAYQIKGSFEYHTEGPIFEDMKVWNLPGKPGHAAAVLTIDQLYSGAKRLV